MNDTLKLIPTTATIVVANILPSGPAFAVRLDDGANCYIPVNVARSINLTVGSELEAKLVANRYPDKADRTPWLAVHIAPATMPVAVATARPVQYAMPFDQFDEAVPTSAPTVSTYDKVRAVMKEGGVWTLAAMFEEVFPGRTRGDGLADYNAVSAALRKMFADNECSKFSFWRTSEQVKPGRDWFTCYPDRADVDEWEA
jgi:hypothetical protein